MDTKTTKLKKQIKSGFYALLLLIFITTGSLAISLIYGIFNLHIGITLTIIDIIVLSGFSIGLYKNNFISAAILVVYFISSRIGMLIAGALTGIPIIYLILLFFYCQAAYAAYVFNKTEKITQKNTSNP